ncbi:MAG: linear amide C-N hydrolase [Liquorilactobacillus nagelii]|uniref:linear amide C-N hydrolase n=1 Tax=Liquorilactobacillus nagelii TaxID=82688 RepID=UPI0039ECB832
MCTSITIKSRTGDLFFGRTLDCFPHFFDDDSPFKVEMTIFPKGTLLTGQLDSWKTKYAIGGLNIKNTIALYDGINDAGLAGELNALGECTWADINEIRTSQDIPLMGEEVITYMLSHFNSVDEIKANFKKYALADVSFAPAVTSNIFKKIPSHYTFVDTTGKGIILEPVNNGYFKIYDSIGVMANSPEYDWQVTNLRNYVQLQGYNAGNTKLIPTLNESDILLKEIGYGSGLLGLPGDYTSTSRFVRAAFLSRYIDDFDSSNGINVLFNTFTTVMVPKGVERVSAASLDSDSTLYWSGYDLSKQIFYVKAANTNTWLRRNIHDYDHEVHFSLPIENVYA